MSIAARAPAPAAAAPHTLRKAIAALTVTQMIGWGTTFHVPAVLSDRIAPDLGLSRAFVFGGLTIMLIVAAFISPAVGRVLDRDGARRWMIIGSGGLALGLAILAGSRGPLTFILAWVVIGFVMPFALNQGASTALVQIAPDRARRAIAVMLLMTGMSSTVAWPVLLWLDAHLGWRAALLVCATLNLVIAAPLNAFGLPVRRTVGARPVGPPPGGSVPEPLGPPPPGTFALAAAGFSLAGILTWGLPLLMIAILTDLGHGESEAVAIGALLGPGQVLARAFEMAGGHRFGILAVGVGSAALMPLALLALLLWGTSTVGAVLFVVGYGVSAGLISIVRAVAPLRLFGVAGYATVLGRLGLPQNIAFAAAPVGFAYLREHVGVRAVLDSALVIGVLCLLVMAALAWRAPPIVPSPTPGPG